MTSVPPGGRTAPPYAIGAVVGAAGALLLAHPFGWTPSVAATALALAGLWYYSRGAEGQTRAASVATSTDWHLATIEALACAIDAKYHPAQPHTRRVQVYAAGLARAAGLGPDELQGVRTAALLHDIGELAVPEHILSKSGPLTREEFQKIRIHPRVSAEIIASVRFPYPVAPLILSHHERWDGTGYPQRLTGAQIPLGARILTVVDYFDALTTERPYRRAFEWNRAIQLLQEEAGKALDPVLVGTFVDILPALVAEYEAAARRDREPTPGRRRGSGDAFKHIALANREIHVLYEIAQTMGTSLGIADTMALISSKLSKIIPWSGCALFLYDAATDQLRCRFADGLDAPRLVGLTVAAGLHTAGGDVPRGRTILNGDPRATFTASGVSAPTDLRSAIVCPLSFEDELIGCVEFYHTTPNHYTADHQRLIEQVAEQAGAVVHNAIRFEQTEEDSLTDPLTALPNRRSLFTHLAREFARAERLGTEVALVIMDVDGFKSINDTFGHNVGDEALREVSGALQAALRPYDLCVRYAGDEFVVVISNCSREAAEAKRQEFQALLGEIRIEVAPGRVAHLAVSAGAAVFPHDGGTYDDLMAAADRRMYRDKEARRGAKRMAQASLPALAPLPTAGSTPNTGT